MVYLHFAIMFIRINNQESQSALVGIYHINSKLLINDTSVVKFSGISKGFCVFKKLYGTKDIPGLPDYRSYSLAIIYS